MTGNSQFVPGFTKKSKRSKTSKKPGNKTHQLKGSKVADWVAEKRGLRKTEVKNGWVPKGEYVEVAGRIIGGMVYIGNSDISDPKVDVHLRSAGCIDLAKPVHGLDRKGELINTCSFSELEPASRGSYLDWLAGGRNDRNFHPAYAQIYFYGLEQRMLWDVKSDDETHQLVWEIFRLKSAHSKCAELVRLIERQIEYHFTTAEPMNSRNRYPNEFLDFPLELLVGISESLYEGRPLTGNQMFQWLSHDYPSNQYDGFAFHELESEFMKEFSRAYPDGMPVEKPDRPYQIEFQSIGNKFTVRDRIEVNGRRMLDIFSLKDPLRQVESMLDEITGKMPKPASANASSNGMSLLNFHLSGNTKKATPANVQNMYPDIVNWARKKARSQYRVHSLELINVIAGADANSMAAVNMKDVLDALALIGFGLAPHVVFMTENQTGDEPLFLYESDVNHLARPEDMPLVHAAMYRLGITVSMHIDGGFDADTIRSRLRDIDSSFIGLSKSDIAALHANVEYLLLYPPGTEFFEQFHEPGFHDWNTEVKSQIVECAMNMDLEHGKAVAMVNQMYSNVLLDPMQAESDVRNAKLFPTQSKWLAH